MFNFNIQNQNGYTLISIDKNQYKNKDIKK